MFKADADGPNWTDETVRQTLKKNGMTQRKIPYWVIPPEANSEFVAHVENILDTNDGKVFKYFS